MTGRPSLVGRLLVAMIGFYRRAISPIRPATCRYSPSCSAYALEAIEVHGAVRGSVLALRRLGRCHPFHRGGHDPVPEPVAASGNAFHLKAWNGFAAHRRARSS